jgi:hypothetical protein
VELSKEAILSRTHYGLNIYAHVLRQYKTGTVLSLSGRDCQPAVNPFNNNRATLHISIVDNCAVHKDAELPAFKGDPLDFAAMHYGLSGQELFKKLNEAMHLHIGESYTFVTVPARPKRSEGGSLSKGAGSLSKGLPAPRLAGSLSNGGLSKGAGSLSKGLSNGSPSKESLSNPAQTISGKITAPVFSYFHAPVTNTVPARSISLVEVYELVKGKNFISQTATLRTITDKKQAKAYKAANFTYVTFSGIFSKRADKALQKHSGLLTIDLDHIGDIPRWRSKLLADEYFETELLFASPSGDGLKWILPIDLTKATHLDYFKSISNYMLLTYHLKIDNSGSDPSRACFLPHDPNIYINPKYLG